MTITQYVPPQRPCAQARRAPRSARPRPVGSRPADLPRYGNWGEKGLGFFHLGTGFWLFYLMFAAVLNFTLKYTLPL
jgi:hypothetical protein